MVWKELQIHNWEQIHGPVPKGMVLRCLTDDPLNCDPSNWELITRLENVERNSGRRDLTDKYIIDILSRKMPEIKEEVSSMPELIEMKRAQLKLNRQLNERN